MAIKDGWMLVGRLVGGGVEMFKMEFFAVVLVVFDGHDGCW
jgi:hypothetical protein